MLNYPLYSIHPSHNIPVRDHAKPTFAPRVTEFVRLLLCAVFSNHDDTGLESRGEGMYVIVGPSSDYKVSSTYNTKATAYKASKPEVHIPFLSHKKHSTPITNAD
jgi:hypothetical protein